MRPVPGPGFRGQFWAGFRREVSMSGPKSDIGRAEGPDTLGAVLGPFAFFRAEHRRFGGSKGLPPTANPLEKVGPEIKLLGSKRPPFCRKAHWKRWRAKPPTFLNGFCGRRGPRIPHNLMISGPEDLLT